MNKSALFGYRGYLWKELAAANEVKTTHSLQNMKIDIVFILIMKKYSYLNKLCYRGQACFDIDVNETINVKSDLAPVVFILFFTEYLLTKKLISGNLTLYRYLLIGHLNIKARKLIHVYSGFNSFFIVSSPRKLHQRKFRLLKNHGWQGSQNSPSRENENTPCESALL